jgi:hypothetical protein
MIFPHLNLLFPLHYSCLLFLISKSICKGVLNIPSLMSILYFDLFKVPSLPLPIHYLTLTLTSHSSFFQHLSIHILISSTFTGNMYYDLIDALSFPFPFPPSSSSIVFLSSNHYHQKKESFWVTLNMYLSVYLSIYLYQT